MRDNCRARGCIGAGISPPRAPQRERVSGICFAGARGYDRSVSVDERCIGELIEQRDANLLHAGHLAGALRADGEMRGDDGSTGFMLAARGAAHQRGDIGVVRDRIIYLQALERIANLLIGEPHSRFHGAERQLEPVRDLAVRESPSRYDNATTSD